ncbi:MAG: hypothetical protein QOC59_1316, partial [Microbacteriaceae bacterium]|nr:hypothetical protein [Microbacteriaceae bacterium]
ASGAVGTFEATRVAVGPRAEYVVEVFGTAGSVRWNFERMNELEVSTERNAAGGYGYTRVLAEPGFGDFARFQPGAGTAMGFDDLKVIEAAQFLRSVITGEQVSPSVADGLAAARVADAAATSAASGAWEHIPAPTGRITFDAAD